MVDINIKSIKEKDLEKIDQAAKTVNRSRSNFMVTSSLEIALKIKKIKEKQNE